MSDRYFYISERRGVDLPSNRRIIWTPNGLKHRVVKELKPGHFWIYDKVNKKFMMVPANGVPRAFTQNYRINNYGYNKIPLGALNKVFPKMNNMANKIHFSPLRPSMYALKAEILRKLTDAEFSDMAYDISRKKFDKDVKKVKVFGGTKWETISEVKTRNQQLNLRKSMYTGVMKFPTRIDITTDKFNIQIYPSSIILNGKFDNPMEIPINRIDGRLIFEEGADKLDDIIERFIPPNKKSFRDYDVTNINIDFNVDQKIKDPLMATKNGIELTKIIRKVIKDDRNIPNKMADFIPSFSYEYGENRNVMNELRNMGANVPQYPDNIYLRYDKPKKDYKAKGGSYISWKKGYIRIQGADSLEKIFMMVRTVQLWYAIMMRDNPGVLEKIDLGKAKMKTGKKLVAKKENIEKVGNVKLEIYAGKGGVKKLKVNGKICDKPSSFTAKELKAIGAKMGVVGVDKMKKEDVCAELMQIALKKNTTDVKLKMKGGKVSINGKTCLTYPVAKLQEFAKKLFISPVGTRTELCGRIEREFKRRESPNLKKKLAKARGVLRRGIRATEPKRVEVKKAKNVIRRAIAKKMEASQARLLKEMENELEREFAFN